MGKVYSFSDIVNKKIPKSEDFVKAKKIVLDELSKFAEEGEIYGAKIFGSVAKGTPNERSDFDLLIVTEQNASLTLLKNIFENVRDQTNVGIEPLVIDRKFAEKGFHSIDNLFLEHIRSIPDENNIAGLNPLNILKPFDLPILEVHKQYLAQKLRRLREGVFTYSEIDKLRVLQRALEEPVNLGRRTLQVLPCLGYPLEMEDDGKQNVIKLFQETFGTTSLINEFNTLLQHDKNYTSYLIEALKGTMTQYNYETKINSLVQECIPRAIAWTSDMSLTYIKFLEGNNRLEEGSIAPRGHKELFR